MTFTTLMKMRPDKKKKVHHDSQKAKNRALASSNDASESKNSSYKKAMKNQINVSSSEVGKNTNSTKMGVNSPDENKDVTETRTESNSDVNSGKDYSKRKIENNWAEYELPSTDSDPAESDNEIMTGLDFNYAIQNALKSDSMFRMKAEKEWEEKQTMFTNEIFSLDLANLEKAVSCVPLPVQLNISKSQFKEQLLCPETYQHLVDKAKINFENWVDELNDGPTDDIETVNERLVSLLISKPEADKSTKSSRLSDIGSSSSNNIIKNDNSDTKLSDLNSTVENPTDTNLDDLLNVNATHNKPLNNVKISLNTYNDDQSTEQVESKPAQINVTNRCEINSASTSVSQNQEKFDSETLVSDQKAKNDTKNLEDWLDDFLSD